MINKFQKVIIFIMKWVTILWNMSAAFLMGVFALVELGYSESTVLGYTPGILWYIGITIFINVINFWNITMVKCKFVKK